MVQATPGASGAPDLILFLPMAIFVVYNELMKYRGLHPAFVWDVFQKPC